MGAGKDIMTVTILHSNGYEPETESESDELLRDLRFDGDVGSIRQALAAGLYLAVATMEGDDPRAAFEATQNDSGSWSRHPGEGLAPMGAGTVDTAEGPLGYRDSITGDLFVTGDKVFVARRGRIEQVDVEPPRPGDVRAIGGGHVGMPTPGF